MIGLNIRTHASPKVGQDQVSGGVSVFCLHATPVANVLYVMIYYLLCVIYFDSEVILSIKCAILKKSLYFALLSTSDIEQEGLILLSFLSSVINTF